MRVLLFPLQQWLAVLILSAGILAMPVGAIRAEMASYEAPNLKLQRLEQLTARGIQLIQAGDLGAGTIALETAAAHARRHLSPDDPRYVKSLNNLALAYEFSGLLDRSEKIYRQGIAIVQQGQPQLNQLSDLQNNLAAVVLQQCRISDAQALYEQAFRLSIKARGPDHADTKMVQNNLDRVNRYLGAPVPAPSPAPHASTHATSVRTNSDDAGNIATLLQRCIS